jgi:hypothetical protein
MPTTLPIVRDRLGHAAALVLVVASPSDAAPGDDRARRFDVLARAVNGAVNAHATAGGGVAGGGGSGAG